MQGKRVNLKSCQHCRGARSLLCGCKMQQSNGLRYKVVALTVVVAAVLSGVGETNRIQPVCRNKRGGRIGQSTLAGSSMVGKGCKTRALPSSAASGVRVSERFGYDPVDSTRYIQQALDSGLPEIIIDKKDTPWITRPLCSRTSNQMVVLEDEVELVAKRGEFKDPGAALVRFMCVTNVTLRGGVGSGLRMWKCDYTNAVLYAKSEWRHAVGIYCSDNVVVENLRIVGSGGDGIYLGEKKRGFPNTRIAIRNMSIIGCHRQGISVITADGLLVENSMLADTCGTPPESGIDFEPNKPWQVLSGIVLRNCTFRNNAGCGLELEPLCLTESSRPLDIVVEGCTSESNAKGKVRLQLKPNPIHDVRGRVVFRNCRLLDAEQTPAGLRVRDGQPTPFTLALENCTVRDPSASGGMCVMNESWKHVPPLVGPDGKELTYCRFTPPARVDVHDAHPGELVALGSPWYRFRTRFHLYAAKAGKMHVKVHRRWISKQKFQGTFQVYGPDGTLVKELPRPGEDPSMWEIDAHKPGFYVLAVDVGAQMIGMLAADVPIAMTGGGHTYNVDPALIAPGGSYHLLVPSAAPRFAVMAEGRDREVVTARLFDPMGRLVDSAEGVNGRKFLFSPKKPAAGLWRIDLSKPKRGYFEDHSVDVIGIQPVFFLSREKTWSIQRLTSKISRFSLNKIHAAMSAVRQART